MWPVVIIDRHWLTSGVSTALASGVMNPTRLDSGSFSLSRLSRPDAGAPAQGAVDAATDLSAGGIEGWFGLRSRPGGRPHAFSRW